MDDRDSVPTLVSMAFKSSENKEEVKKKKLFSGVCRLSFHSLGVVDLMSSSAFLHVTFLPLFLSRFYLHREATEHSRTWLRRQVNLWWMDNGWTKKNGSKFSISFLLCF